MLLFDFQDKQNLCFRTAEGCHGLPDNAFVGRRPRSEASVAPARWLPDAGRGAYSACLGVQNSLDCNSKQAELKRKTAWIATQNSLNCDTAFLLFCNRLTISGL